MLGAHSQRLALCMQQQHPPRAEPLASGAMQVHCRPQARGAGQGRASPTTIIGGFWWGHNIMN